MIYMNRDRRLQKFQSTGHALVKLLLKDATRADPVPIGRTKPMTSVDSVQCPWNRTTTKQRRSLTEIAYHNEEINLLLYIRRNTRLQTKTFIFAFQIALGCQPSIPWHHAAFMLMNFNTCRSTCDPPRP
jgi:hypothetical protein